MTLALQGKHALVTGAGRGIGAAIAMRLAAEGAQVTLLGRTRGTLEETAQRLGTMYANASTTVVVCDVTDATAFEAALARLPRVDILINNAGQAVSAPVTKTTDTLWAQMLAVNLSAPFTCTRSVLPGMLKAGWGRVVTVASSKFGACQLPSGVVPSTAHCVTPGVKTPQNPKPGAPPPPRPNAIAAVMALKMAVKIPTTTNAAYAWITAGTILRVITPVTKPSEATNKPALQMFPLHVRLLNTKIGKQQSKKRENGKRE